MSTNARLYGKGLLGDHKPDYRGPLREKFIIPPFSVWNTRDGTWQDRKRRWLRLGIRSEEGRAGKLTFNIPIELRDGRKGNKIRNQTSIFDPVVCELCYTWWARAGRVVLDPFAGGSVRGIVASVLGLKYYGIELRADQVKSNREQINEETSGKFKPRWVVGDSRTEVHNAPRADFLLSCPPYGNLEVYSNDEADISNKDYKEFYKLYGEIIAGAVDRLRPNRFAAWVVANYRDKKTGEMHDFVGDTVRAFRRAGMSLYNEIILVNAVGSAAMRANTSFLRGARKVCKSHQNVLVFVKGDPRAAVEELGGTHTDEEG